MIVKGWPLLQCYSHIFSHLIFEGQRGQMFICNIHLKIR